MPRSTLHAASIVLRRLARVRLSRAMAGALLWCVLLGALVEQPRLAIAEVQSASNATFSYGTVTCSFGSPNTAGNLLIAATGVQGPGNYVATITDSRGNTYTPANSTTDGNANNSTLFYAADCAGGANTVTVTASLGYSFSSGASVTILEFSGVLPALPLDYTAVNTGTSSPLTTGAVPVNAAHELVIGTFYGDFTGFSASVGLSSAGGGAAPAVAWTLDTSAATAITGTASDTHNYAAVGASFLPAGYLFAGPGSFALAGLPVTFAGNMAAGLGAFALTGEPAPLNGTWNVGEGAFSLTGLGAFFTFFAGEGTFTLNGLPATFQGSMAAGEGAFALTGEPATFAGTWNVSAGNYTLNGHAIGEDMIQLTGSGGLFTRLGKLVGALNDLNAFRGGDLPGELTKAVVDAMAQLDGDPSLAIRATESTLPAAQTQAYAALTAMAKSLQTCAQNLLITMANNDTPLSSLSVSAALTLLKQQMLAGSLGGSYTGGYYVNPQTLGYGWTPTAGNVGNGNIVVGLRDIYGFDLDNLLGEAIGVSVFADATAGAEQLQLLGAASNSDALSSAWPAGSGMNKVLTSLLDSAGGNLITNGSMEAWTANVPTSWTAVVGTAGTDFGQDSANQYLGASCLKLIGGTGVLSQITLPQTGLAARTPYALNVQLKASVVPAAGTLIIDLYNGTSVIQDEAGNNCSLSINLHGLTTSYVPYSIVWQIADRLPATVTLRVRLSVAISGGSTIYLDSLAMQAATRLGSQLGDSGFAAVFGGSSNWTLRDTGTLTIANSRTCQWQPAFDRLFSDRQSGFVLPTTGGTLIPDSLIGD